MKNTKAILAGTLMAPALALTGGIAYASTTSHSAPARATVTATAQHPIGQARLGWCDWRYTGHWCDRHNYGHQPRTAHQRSHHATYRHHSYQHRSGYGTWGNRGYGYQGGWGTGSGSHRGTGDGCRHGW